MKFSKTLLLNLSVIGIGFTQYTHADNTSNHFVTGACGGLTHALIFAATVCLGREYKVTNYFIKDAPSLKLLGQMTVGPEKAAGTTAYNRQNCLDLGLGAIGFGLGAVPADKVSEYLHQDKNNTTEAVSYWATFIAVSYSLLKAHEYLRPQ